MPTVNRVCAIHQPNLFPRWRTLAKILAADTWVVLDDVQFCRRDYQHRARLGRVSCPQDWQWLILPVHLPNGQVTVIRDVRLADRSMAQRRVRDLSRQYYRRSPGWPFIGNVVDVVAAKMGSIDSLGEIAELSTALLLQAYNWTGSIVRASSLGLRSNIDTERSSRLVDLTRAAGCGEYLCGRSGKSYLDVGKFSQASIGVSFFELSESEQGPAGELSALARLANAN